MIPALIMGVLLLGGLLALAIFVWYLFKNRRPDKMPPFEQMIDELSARSTSQPPKILNEAEVRKLVFRLAKSYTMAGAVDRIWLESEVENLGPRAVPALVGLLEARAQNDKSLFRRITSLLKPHHPVAAIPALTRASKHPDEEFRQEAINALAHIGADACIEPLAQALNDSNPEIREGTVIALYHSLDAGRGTLTFRSTLFEPVSRLLQEKPTLVPSALLRMDCERAMPFLIQSNIFSATNSKLGSTLEAADSVAAVIPIEVLLDLVTALQPNLEKWPNGENYGRCLKALARSTDARAEEIIVPAMSHSNEEIYHVAAEALMNLKCGFNLRDRIKKRIAGVGYEVIKPEQKHVANLLQFVGRGRYDVCSVFPSGACHDYEADLLRALEAVGATNTLALLRKANEESAKRDEDPDAKKRHDALTAEVRKDPEKVSVKLCSYVVAKLEVFQAL